MNLRTPLIAALCAVSIATPLAAQAGEVRTREAHQEHRIYQGVANGSLTQGEYGRLQRDEARINGQRQEDLENGNGHLSAQQALRLNREENRLSGRIYADKHNSVKPPQ